MIFKKGHTWYGVALELNIVETGNDPREVGLMLGEAMHEYVEVALHIKASPKVLNQKTSPEYEKLWKQLETKTTTKATPTVYTSGFFWLPSSLRFA